MTQETNLVATPIEIAKLRKRYKICKYTNKYKDTPYYTKVRFLYIFWVFNIGMFSTEENAEEFLQACIKREICQNKK